ncbi:MAG TPA: DoxX family protein [Gammaproteobacteria bacterium]|nr:DoxX family protein [Gammaproteobacteria bacterium]
MHPSTADNVGKLILRIVLGILILLHGIAKIQGGVGWIVDTVGFLGYAVYLGEVLAPVLLIIGWHARIGAALVAINMLFAIGIAHTNEIFALTSHGGWQIELQGMYLFAALALVFTGPGKLGVNQR